MFLQKLTHYKIHHVLFWLAYFIFWVVVYDGFYSDKVLLYKVTILYMMVHMTMYYVSQYHLVRIVLKKGNAFLFVFGFLSLAALLALIHFLLLKTLFEGDMATYFGENPSTFYMSFLLSNIFIGGLLIGVKSIFDRVRAQRLADQTRQENLLTELSYLKAQVNPHFLFNTINSVYVLIKIDPDQAAETLIKLSDLLRAQLYDFSQEKITIEQELTYLDNYIELEKIRRGKRVKVEVEKSGELNGFSIPPLLLIPFLENCFKHLSSYSDKDNLVRVVISRDEKNLLEVDFENTFERNMPKQPGGIGLNNVSRRLELLFPNKYELVAGEKEDVYHVNLKLQLDEQ